MTLIIGWITSAQLSTEMSPLVITCRVDTGSNWDGKKAPMIARALKHPNYLNVGEYDLDLSDIHSACR